MPKRPIPRTAIVLCPLLLFAAFARGSEKPNIVFILADDLGWTDLGCQGSKYYETPNIDRMAREGMRFTSGYTCGPNCQPTRAALMSGQYGPRTGIYTVGNINRFPWQSRPLRPVVNAETLPPDRETIAQALKKAGYATGMFGKWHLGNQWPNHPKQRGFDEALVSAGRHFNFDVNPRVSYPEGTYLADFLTDKAEDFIRRHKDEPFFLYLPHFAVHGPHQAKEDLIKKFEPKKPEGGHRDPTYAAMIDSVDESVGRILELLRELKLEDNTLVIFSSDNGGVGGYRESGIPNKDGITSNTPLKGGKGMLYEGGIRVPYIFRWPGKVSAGTVSDETILSVDLYPTLLELAGGAKPAQTLDGVSYLSLLFGDGSQTLDRTNVYWHFPGYLGANQGHWRTTPVSVVRSGDWKLLEFLEDGRLELYNIREDIGESRNLASTMPDKTRELREQLVGWRQSIQAPMPTPNEKPVDAAPKPRKKRKNVADQ